MNKDEFKEVLDKIHASLDAGGVFYISLKLAEEYQEHIKIDKFGKRLFYLYNSELIEQMSKGKYTCVFYEDGFVTSGNTAWFEIALMKK